MGASDTAWLDSVLLRAQALLFDGPAGIGKSHRWDAAIAAARARGFRVLRARPALAEVRLVGSALIDLCVEITEAEIGTLPPPQAGALRSALLRGDDDVAPINPQAVALAFTGLLRAFAALGPVLVCVDDVQWLDAQTSAVLGFAARRLPSGAGLLLALRTEPNVADPELIADVAAALPLLRETVLPLDDSRLGDVVRSRLGATVPASVLRSVISSSGGNPLFGVEIARALVQRGRREAPGQVPVPSSLGELVMRHLVGLPEPTRLGLAAASALRRPSLRQLRELGVAPDLPPAEHAGLIRIDGHEVVFTHPIYAAAAYDVLATSERMALHRRLAAVVEGSEERARHLALGADESDEQVAAALDLARAAALQRGAIQAALDASELAVRATPRDGAAFADRLTTLGGLLFRTGETARAKAVFGDALEAAADPLQRARALHALARVVHDTEGGGEAIPLELEALDLAGDEQALQADIRMGLAVSYEHDWDVALVHADVACALLDADPGAEPLKVAAALTARVGAAFYAGAGADLESCRRAIELEMGDVSRPVFDRALAVLLYLQLWIDDFPAARAQMRLALDLAEAEGDEPSRCYILINMANVETRAGNWDRALALLDDALAIADRAEIDYYAGAVRDGRLMIGLWRGEYDGVAERAEGLITAGRSMGSGLIEQRGYGLRGITALLRGDTVTAAADLDRYIELFDSAHAREPALRQYAGEHVEALVGAGRLADAERALAVMVGEAERLDRTVVLAAAARAEALLTAERGDLDAAVLAAERSLALYDRIERRFDRARALLTKGQVHRRFKQKSLARRELAAALAEFEELGAVPFAERARAELSRIGLRPPAALGLTYTEQQIADLTATGLTSAEIAARLFLSTKTVSSNLTRIYRKLGVRNRAELTALLAARKGS